MNLGPYNTVWRPMQPVLYAMERQGFPVDLGLAATSGSRARAALADASAQLQAQVPGLNPRSADQINAWLRREGVPPSPVTKKGPPRDGAESTDADALSYLADHHPAVAPGLRLILQIRKIHSSIKYLDKLAYHAWAHGDGATRVHCSITRNTATGRLAAARPELQQIPKDLRKDPYGVRSCFIPSPGYELVVVDQSQLEMRILAHYLIRLFGDDSLANDLAKQDCHSANALRVFGPVRPYLHGVQPHEVKAHSDVRVAQCRDDIKAVIYGMNYGKGDVSLGTTLRDEHGEPVGRAVARKVMDGIFELYPGLRPFHDWVRAELRRTGGISTLLGRFRALDGARSGSRRAWRQGINTPMQGGGADIMDLAALAVSRDKELDKMGYRMLVPVHDEIVGEVPLGRGRDAGARVVSHFENAYSLEVPLVASLGVVGSWAGGH